MENGREAGSDESAERVESNVVADSDAEIVVQDDIQAPVEAADGQVEQLPLATEDSLNSVVIQTNSGYSSSDPMQRPDSTSISSVEDGREPPRGDLNTFMESSLDSSVQQEESMGRSSEQTAGPSSTSAASSKKTTIRSFRIKIDENGETLYEFDSDTASDPSIHSPSSSEVSDSDDENLRDVAIPGPGRRVNSVPVVAIDQAEGRNISDDEDDDEDYSMNHVMDDNGIYHRPQGRRITAPVPVGSVGTIGSRVQGRRGIPQPTLAPTARIPGRRPRLLSSDGVNTQLSAVVGTDPAEPQPQPSTSGGSRRRKATRPKKRSKKQKNFVPKKKKRKPSSPPKPLQPKMIVEEESGNENLKIYSKKIQTETKYRLNVSFENENQKADTTPYHESKKVKEGANSANSPAVKIGEVFLKDVGAPTAWTAMNSTDLNTQFPGLFEFCVFVSNDPTLSIIRLKTAEILSDEESANRPKPKGLKGNDLKRKLMYTVHRHYFFHCDLEEIDYSLFSTSGLGSKKTFRLAFRDFEPITRSLRLDVNLLESAILDDHNLGSISYRSEQTMVAVLNYFLCPETRTDGLNSLLRNDEKEKEDIAWFYGQIKKYHTQEALTDPSYSLQPECVRPQLRNYQKEAVKWMLHKENAIPNDQMPSTRPSSSKNSPVDIISAFYEKVYKSVQVETTSEDGTKILKTAFFNTFCGYMCWSKPKINTFTGGGLLCDEMGLGKTVEVICLILLHPKPECKSDDDSLEVHAIKREVENVDIVDNEKDVEEKNSSARKTSRRRAIKRKLAIVSSDEEKEASDDSDPEWQDVTVQDLEDVDCRPRRSRNSLRDNRPSLPILPKDETDDISLCHPRLRRKRKLSPCVFKADDESCNNNGALVDAVSTEQDDNLPGPSLHQADTDMEQADEVYNQGEIDKQRIPSIQASDFKTETENVMPTVTSPSKKTRKSSCASTGPSKPETTYSRVKSLYDAALNEYSAAKSLGSAKFHGTFFDINVGRKAFFECICGGYNDDHREVVTCTICGSSQHVSCVGWTRNMSVRMSNLGRGYECPHCAVSQDPFPVKTTLIITPNTISHQWINEIQRHVKNRSLSILLYKGVSIHGYLSPHKFADYDLVITTYGVLSTELNYVDLPHTNSDEGRRFRNSKRYLSIPSPLPCVHWWRLCLDEAQMVEGIGTKMALMAMRLPAQYRWGITGTPINEGLQDLFGLFAFLGLEPISYDYWWNKLIRDPFYRKETSLLYEVFGQFIWRTGKPDVLDQLGIPPQTEKVRWLTFSPVETHFYKQQHEICSTKILTKINRLKQVSVNILQTKLSALDRQTLQSLLQPFLDLRQACCHPQMVKGQLISLQKGTLTMEELLAQLMKKTSVQCAEDHRLMVSALNGMAGIHIIREEWIEASEKYREVLQSADKNKEYFPTDSLQLLHTIENLADLLDRHHDGIPYTLRDDSLRTEAEQLTTKYMKKYADGVDAAKKAVAPITSETEALFEKFQCTEQSWWAATLSKAARLDKIDNLISRIRDDLIDRTKKLNNVITLANKFNDAFGLQHVLVETITQIESIRQQVLQGLEDLQKDDISSFVHAAVACHLRKKSESYYKDSDETGFRCNLCRHHDDFLRYESIIFKEEKKQKAVRTGRRWQQQKIMGPISTNLTEEERNIALLKEEEELLESLADVQIHLSNEHRRGTWGDSDTEKILKNINNFARINGLPAVVLEDGATHMKLFEFMKKEFRLLRILWRQIYDQVSAVDELSQATTRLRLRFPDEKLPSTSSSEQPSTSLEGRRDRATTKKPKELKSGTFEQDHKIQVINILERHDLEPKMQQMHADLENGKHELSIHMGQLLYLDTLKKNGYGKAGSSNSEDCPVCQLQLGMKWSVLRCGHSFCSDCVKKMCPNTFQVFLCPLCRVGMKYADVSFVDTRGFEDDDPGEGRKPKVEIKGSHSTKVQAVVETLMKLQDSHPGEKAIVFSSWTEVLEIISKALDQNDIKNCILSKPGKAFQTQLDRFKKREDVQVLLIPMASGSKGLNIIEATHVLLVEPNLNSASELQAIGRVHRIGQTKPTFVHRFYIKRTIEEQLFEILQNQDISSDDEGSLTVSDLQNIILQGESM